MKNILCRTIILIAISLSSSTTTKAEPCAIVQTQSNCAPKCNIFYNVQPGRFPSNMIRSYAGRDLKDLTNGDLDHLRNDFIFCNATQSINMTHGVSDAEFPAFVNKTISDLKQQRDQQVSGAPNNPIQAALQACPTATEHFAAFQAEMKPLLANKPNPHTQEGMKQTCSIMQKEIDGFQRSADELQTCKNSGVVGLQPVIQQMQGFSVMAEQQYHQACD